jgi:hypothetical protein
VAAESAGATKIEDKERRLRRQYRRAFSSSVGELTSILMDAPVWNERDQKYRPPYGHEQEYRLHKLWQALGSTAFLCHRWTEGGEVRAKIGRAAYAADKKKQKSRLLDDAIIQAARPIWQSNRTSNAWRVAGQMIIKAKGEAQWPISQHSLNRRLRRLKSTILGIEK